MNLLIMIAFGNAQLRGWRGIAVYDAARVIWVLTTEDWMQVRIRKTRAALLLAGLLAMTIATSAAAQDAKPASGAVSMPKVGEMAPDFTLKYFDGNDLKSISLSQYRGKKNVVLAFFIFAFTGG